MQACGEGERGGIVYKDEGPGCRNTGLWITAGGFSTQAHPEAHSPEE